MDSRKLTVPNAPKFSAAAVSTGARDARKDGPGKNRGNSCIISVRLGRGAQIKKTL
jgi:hypothetical protein